MTRFDFLSYNDKPCKFRLRSGKTVFGVIWESKANERLNYRFASLGERFTIYTNGGQRENKNIGQMVDLEDIIHAEPMPQEALSA
ncbi:MAG TPA: hypothetical protein VGO45_11630 [Bacteroidia bacterium]|jgi:predicted AlkP superfamily pyrophosphatase or phosphodiesterase|nr:hypothetical protein [Bacteroidia bacterium]